MDEARTRLKAAQVPFLDRLESALAQRVGEGS
jgi:predicted NUDIX family NTP pyrophosphohydrolase